MSKLGVPRSSMYSFGASDPGGLKRISLIQISPRAEAQASQSSPNNIRALGRLNRFISEVSPNLLQKRWIDNGAFQKFNRRERVNEAMQGSASLASLAYASKTKPGATQPQVPAVLPLPPAPIGGARSPLRAALRPFRSQSSNRRRTILPFRIRV